MDNQAQASTAADASRGKRRASGPPEYAVDAAGYSCHCGRSFSRIENLARHSKTHLATRDWSCGICDKSFTRSDLLKRHALTHEKSSKYMGIPDLTDASSSPRRRTASKDASTQRSSSPTEGSDSQTDRIGASGYAASSTAHSTSKAGHPQRHSSSAPDRAAGPMIPIVPTAGSNPYVDPPWAVSPDHLQVPLQVLSGKFAPDFLLGGPSIHLPDPHAAQSQRLVWDAIGLERSPQDATIWDNGMHWILDDPTAFGQDTLLANDPLLAEYMSSNYGSAGWPSLEAGSDSRPGLGVDPAFLSSMLSELGPAAPRQQRPMQTLGAPDTGLGSGRMSPRATASRAISPPADATTEEDKWPSNWRPGARTSRLGAGSLVTEIHSIEEIGPGLARWQNYWIGAEILAKVRGCFALANTAPGAPVADFQMPRSLHTINHFISLYFEHFEPQLSIIHIPTFKIADASPLLVASFIMIGANYSDLKGARAFAVELVEVLRKTLHALFEDDARNLRSVQIIHVYMLSMVAGLWCGNKRTYELAEASRGTLINLLRKAELLNSSAMNGFQSLRNDARDIEQRWRQWATAESRKRLGLAICLVDITFPALLDVPAYHSQGDMVKLALPADDRYWDAPTARVWAAMLGMSSCPPCPFFATAMAGLLTPAYVTAEEKIPPVPDLNAFSALVLISSLHHHIYEFRTQLSMYLSAGVRVPLYYPGMSRELLSGFEGRRAWLTDALSIWHEQYYDTRSHSAQMEAARVFWHLGHVSLNVQITALYIASGKRGKEMAQGVGPDIRAWSRTLDAQVAVRNALDMLEVLRTSSRGSIFYPTTAFVACLCLWAYVREWTPLVNEGDEVHATLMRDIQAFVTNGEADQATYRTNPKPSQVLDRGARMLARGKAWRIGAAFALVLASCTEQQQE